MSRFDYATIRAAGVVDESARFHNQTTYISSTKTIAWRMSHAFKSAAEPLHLEARSKYPQAGTEKYIELVRACIVQH
jgi:hypothetical protein